MNKNNHEVFGTLEALRGFNDLASTVNSARAAAEVMQGINGWHKQFASTFNSAKAVTEAMRGIGGWNKQVAATVNSARAAAEVMQGIDGWHKQFASTFNSAKAVTEAMQGIGGWNKQLAAAFYPNGTMADAIKSQKDLLQSLLKPRHLDKLNKEIFGDVVAKYFHDNPLTDIEWEEANKEFIATQDEDAKIDEHIAWESAVADPEQYRKHFAKALIAFIFLAFLAISSATYGGTSNKSLIAFSSNFVAFFSALFAAPHFEKMRKTWPVVQKMWVNRQKPAPLARVAPRKGSLVPIYRSASTSSQVTCWLFPGELVVLNSCGTRRMKSVVIEFDEQGAPKICGWIKRSQLKRLTLKQSYALALIE